MAKRALKAAAGLTGVCVLAVLAAAPAFSQPRAPGGNAGANITGGWTFQTQQYAGGCKMFGQMTISQNASGKHICTFKTEEQCPDVVAKAEEACTAERKGAALSIKSEVRSVNPAIGYDPDDFELKIESSARMTGMMRSFNSAPVEFYRGAQPTS